MSSPSQRYARDDVTPRPDPADVIRFVSSFAPKEAEKERKRTVVVAEVVISRVQRSSPSSRGGETDGREGVEREEGCRLIAANYTFLFLSRRHNVKEEERHRGSGGGRGKEKE